MKISELIKILEDKLSKHGDLIIAMIISRPEDNFGFHYEDKFILESNEIEVKDNQLYLYSE